MENDKIETIGKSVIQHGYNNDRIYLMKIQPDDIESVVQRIIDLQDAYKYGKVFLKIPESLSVFFKQLNLLEEARIPKFYQETEDGLFLSGFNDPKRARDEGYEEIQKNLYQLLMQKESSSFRELKPTNVKMRRAKLEDLPYICALYRSVFETYPFPIYELNYLKKCINEGIKFFIGVTSTGVVAAGSCEIDFVASSVEMSDLAVDPEFRGCGLSIQILSYMEEQMKEEGVKTSYTICRGESLPVNRLFSGSHYNFAGTLIKNTNICGKFESMNVWFKLLT